MSTVHKLIFYLVGVAAVLSLIFGLDYREKQLEIALKDRVALEINQLVQLRSAMNINPPYPELIEEVRKTSTVYFQNKITVQYQLATMSPCNPRIGSCI